VFFSEEKNGLYGLPVNTEGYMMYELRIFGSVGNLGDSVILCIILNVNVYVDL